MPPGTQQQASSLNAKPQSRQQLQQQQQQQPLDLPDPLELASVLAAAAASRSQFADPDEDERKEDAVMAAASSASASSSQEKSQTKKRQEPPQQLEAPKSPKQQRRGHASPAQKSKADELPAPLARMTKEHLMAQPWPPAEVALEPAKLPQKCQFCKKTACWGPPEPDALPKFCEYHLPVGDEAENLVRTSAPLQNGSSRTKCQTEGCPETSPKFGCRGQGNRWCERCAREFYPAAYKLGQRLCAVCFHISYTYYKEGLCPEISKEIPMGTQKHSETKTIDGKAHEVVRWFCVKHAPAEAIQAANVCEAENCTRTKTWGNAVGGRRQYCPAHKHLAMDPVNYSNAKCAAAGCVSATAACWTPLVPDRDGQRKRQMFCLDHCDLETMYNTHCPRCQGNGGQCLASATVGPPGSRRPVRCPEHRDPEDVCLTTSSQK